MDELCAAGLPAALRALLHESSALLRGTAEDMESLPPVIHLVFLLLKAGPRARRALRTDAPDGGGALLLALCAVSKYHPHAREDGTAPCSFLNACVYALKVHAQISELQSMGDTAAEHAVRALMTHLGIDVDTVSNIRAAGSEAQFAAARRLAIRHGWDGSSAAGAAASRRARHNTACDEVRTEGDCAGCNRSVRAGERAFQKCSRCKTTAYCSRACQAAHWKKHKRSCTPAPEAPR